MHVGEGVEVTVRRDGSDLNLSGGSYQPWPESIPYRELDPATSGNYRDLQRRRLGQQLPSTDRLVEQNDDKKDDLADLENFKGLKTALELKSLSADDDIRGCLMVPCQRWPAELLALGAWSFQYGSRRNPGKVDGRIQL